jgi:hypothetical protein
MQIERRPLRNTIGGNDHLFQQNTTRSRQKDPLEKYVRGTSIGTPTASRGHRFLGAHSCRVRLLPLALKVLVPHPVVVLRGNQKERSLTTQCRLLCSPNARATPPFASLSRSVSRGVAKPAFDSVAGDLLWGHPTANAGGVVWECVEAVSARSVPLNEESDTHNC